MAAFANGAMAHCLDYDDQTPWGQHSGSSWLPAVFAIAERRDHQLMCDPLEARRGPSTLVDAKFSLPYIVAVAAANRDVRLADFTAEALKDPRILAAASKVVPIPDRTLDWKSTLPPGRVEILTFDGRNFEAIGTDVPGSASSPMSWDDLVAKFDDCAMASVIPMAASRMQEAAAMARNLESADDATQLMRMLSPHAGASFGSAGRSDELRLRR